MTDYGCLQIVHIWLLHVYVCPPFHIEILPYPRNCDSTRIDRKNRTAAWRVSQVKITGRVE